ncbi:MAG: acyl-CoA desaturase [Stappiaceae bacterium]
MTTDQPDLFRRIDFSSTADPRFGTVRWSPSKSLWWFAMLSGWTILGSLYFSISAVVVFIITCAITLCLGHSIGMHRKLIHDAFECSPAMEKIFVYLGTLVGLGGPFTMMLNHDMRDWAQRQPRCHPFLSHQSPILKDWWWQLHCKLHLDNPPEFQYPTRVADSRFFRLIEHTSMMQQLPPGLLLFAFGGWGWVAWGICGRVCVSIFGHWIIGYFAHNSGARDWHIKGAAVQGHNVLYCGLITFGECWHNNHHAFPGSAKLGVMPGQVDPGWWVLKGMQNLGLVGALNEPADLPERAELSAITAERKLGLKNQIQSLNTG